MNQTQTRSPRKRLLSLLLAVVLMIGLLPISAFASNVGTQADDSGTTAESQEFLRIFHLDCGRKYFTVSEIEGIIDQLAENHYTHIQLAFGNDGLRFLLDDMSVTVNGTKHESDAVKTAIQSGNSGNGLAGAAAGVLTQSDMDAIIAYANKSGIKVIPMFNAPGHMYTAVNAMNILGVGGKSNIISNLNDGRTSNWAVDPTDATAVAFAKALLQKYVTYFAGKGSTMFNIGADESGLDKDNYASYAKMVNDMNAIVKAAGMTTLAYNDGIYRAEFASSQPGVKFDNDIVICYWTEEKSMSVAEFLSKGFKILNNNGDWYYVLGDYLYKAWLSTQWSYQSALSNLQSIPVTKMMGYTGTEQPMGSILCVWCDGPSVGYTTGYGYREKNQTNQQSVYKLIEAMAKANPDYFKDTTPVLAPVDGGTVSPVKQADGSYNVAVAANDTVQLRLANSTAENITWTSGNEAVATVSTNGLVTFTGTTGTVTITAQLQPVTRADEGASYTVTFNVTEKGAPIPVTVAVGRTVKETLQGNQTTISGDSNYSEYVTVQAEHKTTTAEKKLLEITSASDLVSGAQYLIANQRMVEKNNSAQLLTGKATTTATGGWSNCLLLSGKPSTDSTALTDNAALWTITETNSGYTLKNGSSYLNIGNNTASASTTSRSLALACQDNNGTTGYPDRYWNISFSDGGTTYYLNALGGDPGAGGWQYTSDNGADSDIGSRWTIYRIVDEGATDTTTVSFTGKQVGGPVTVTVGDTTYSVTVVKKQNVEIPISIIDYRADGLLFDFQVGGKTYDYGLVHNYDYDRTASSVNGGTLPGESYGTRIAGTTLENTGYDASDSYSGNYYFWGNKWSRSGMVESELGSNGMPVYTDATVARVAQELAAGNYNSDEMAGVANDNDVIYDTFLKSGAARSVVGKDAEKMSTTFASAKTWSNITNAYDLAWYLLNTLYQADTNMTTVTGTDGAGHAVPIYGMKVDAYDRLILTENNGVYSFDAANKKSNYDTESRSIYEDDTASSLQFYPIDGLGYDAILGDTTDKTDSPYQKDENGNITATVRPEHPNGSYTLRGEAQFVYQDNLYFEFSGDDDVYMYINGVLALDLGGAHGICTKRVNLKDVATKCHLTPGEVATFTFFYMERNSDASNFKIETNMELVQRDIAVEKKAYDTNYANEILNNMSVPTGTTVAYDLILTNRSNSVMDQIKFTDTDDCEATVSFGYGVDSPGIAAGTVTKANGSVTLGQLDSYVIYVTEGENESEVANTRQTLTSLDALSKAVAKTKLLPGQSLHVRFLTATFDVNSSTILSYRNTVAATASVGGTSLSDTASHELYSYNANDTGRTYVVDFGLPLKITKIFSVAPSNIGDVQLSSSNTLKYGTVILTGTGANVELVYTRTADKTIDNAETIVLDVVYKMGNSNVSLQKTLTIIPASNVYYEDSLASFQPGKGVAENAKWSTVDNNGNAATEDGGSNVYQALEELGKHRNVYGHDGAYNSSSMLSMGTAHKVTVTSEMLANWKTDDTTSAWPTASFNFTGTGFDIISLTNNKSGAIFVDVYAGSKAEGKAEKKYVVNNYYGYTYNEDTKTWEVTPNVDNTLYQIPVMKITDLAYGEHTVVIKVAYSEYFDTASKNEYSFWLDAIRVYNPMGKDYDYTADNEGYPQYIKLRDELAKTAETNKGVVFIDGAANASIADYANFGPNNEVYLANGQAISFKVPENSEIASIQIGAKAPDGKSASMVVNDNDESARTLNTATEMYYEISKTGNQFTIANKGEGILSLTNLKITYKTSGQAVTLSDLTAAEQANAVAMVQALFAAPVEAFQPETFQASWGRAVRAGKRATLTVKTSADVESITVDGQPITSYTTRTQRTGWGWWSPKVTYHVFTYTITAPARTTDYAVCAVNAEGTVSEPITATLTVRPATWWNWWF